MNDDLKNIIIYSAPTGEVRVDVFVESETVWLTQNHLPNYSILQLKISPFILKIYMKMPNYKKIQLVKNFYKFN